MNRRNVMILLGSSAALAGCGAWPRNPNRAPVEGYIVRPEPERAENMMELLPQGDTVFISGTINQDSAVALRTVKQANPDLQRAVFLDADGATGSAGGIALGRELREAGLSTHLRNDSRVSGAAVDAFLGGTRRTLEDGAMVGAVRSDGADEDYAAYVMEMTSGDGYARYVQEFGGRRRPRPMTIAEIGAMGLISRPEESVLAAN